MHDNILVLQQKMADEMGIGMSSQDVIESTNVSSNSSDFEKQKKTSSKKVPQGPSNEELRIREDFDE